jgi:ABC-type spermidine/putrescine transport system permease subunit II
MSSEVPIHLWQQIETNLDFRTAAVSGVIVVATLIAMALADAGVLCRQANHRLRRLETPHENPGG